MIVSTLRIDDPAAVSHLCHYEGDGHGWASLCNTLDLAKWTADWDGWTARTPTARHRRVVLTWNDTDTTPPICTRCVKRWKANAEATYAWLDERDVAPW